MKYIIMCGGNYTHWEIPRQLSVVHGEELVARTIRLLRECGVDDICISTGHPIFEKFGVPILHHDNGFTSVNFKNTGYWVDAFYPANEPVCYIFGDVFFSPDAIKTIVETETDDIEFFGSTDARPYDPRYIKTHVEPFALKVVNNKHLAEAIETTKKWQDEGRFWREPIAWELWTVIKGLPLQTKPDEYDYESYVGINDYTCDVDRPSDIEKLNKMEV